MAVDKWGLKFLYPTKADGFTWFQKDDISNDSHWEAEDHMSNVGGGSFTINFSGPTSGVIYTDPNFINTNAIGGCNMNFSDTESRGYVYKSNDPKNIELKFIMDADLPGGFSVSQTSGKHSGSGCCSGFAYMINMECDTSPATFRFRKEMWHVSYHTDPKTGDFKHSKFNFKLNGHGNVGIGFVKYIKEDGISKGHDSVVLEFWGNPNPDDDPENWILIKKTEDKGGWGDDGSKCNGNKDQVGSWGMPKFRLKSNSSGSITFKHLSLREIDPSGSFGNPPPSDGGGAGTPEPTESPTTTTRIKGSLKLNRDINIVINSACAPSGFSSFYNVSSNDERRLTDDVPRTRVAAVAKSGSILIGKIPKQLDVVLRKTGTPSDTPHIFAKIWDAVDNVEYTSPTEFLPDTDLTGSLQVKTFDFSTNNYTMQVGDRIGVSYEGFDADNYPVIGITTDDVIDNSKTCISMYGSDWDDIEHYDFAGTIYD